MPIFRVEVCNQQLADIKADVPSGAELQFRTGTRPDHTTDAMVGDVLATIALPDDWLDDPVAGVMSLADELEDPVAEAAGEIGHFAIVLSGTCYMLGTVTETGGGGEMTVDNASVNEGQTVVLGTFTLRNPQS